MARRSVLPSPPFWFCVPPPWIISEKIGFCILVVHSMYTSIGNSVQGVWCVLSIPILSTRYTVRYRYTHHEKWKRHGTGIPIMMNDHGTVPVSCMVLLRVPCTCIAAVLREPRTLRHLLMVPTPGWINMVFVSIFERSVNISLILSHLRLFFVLLSKSLKIGTCQVPGRKCWIA